jgi:hypothetical protein
MADAGKDRIELIDREASERTSFAEVDAFEERAPDPFAIRIGQLNEGVT